jgi:hypothetical protein
VPLVDQEASKGAEPEAVTVDDAAPTAAIKVVLGEMTTAERSAAPG